MQIKTSNIDQAIVLEITGRMDVIAAMEYEKAIMACLQRGDRKFVVDLDALDYISSAGLRRQRPSRAQQQEPVGMGCLMAVGRHHTCLRAAASVG